MLMLLALNLVSKVYKCLILWNILAPGIKIIVKSRFTFKRKFKTSEMFRPISLGLDHELTYDMTIPPVSGSGQRPICDRSMSVEAGWNVAIRFKIFPLKFVYSVLSLFDSTCDKIIVRNAENNKDVKLLWKDGRSLGSTEVMFTMRRWHWILYFCLSYLGWFSCSVATVGWCTSMLSLVTLSHLCLLLPKNALFCSERPWGKVDISKKYLYL